MKQTKLKLIRKLLWRQLRGQNKTETLKIENILHINTDSYSKLHFVREIHPNTGCQLSLYTQIFSDIHSHTYLENCYSLSNLSILSRFSCASSASFAEVLTPSPDFWVFSIIAHALNTNAGTVSCFSCFGMSTKVQYCVSNRITS